MSRRKQKTVEKALGAIHQSYADRPEVWWTIGGENYTRAANSSPVEAAVSLIANDISTLSLSVWRENEDSTYTEAKNLAAYRVINKPNGFQTQTDMLNKLVRDVLYYGNGYLYSDRNARNEVVALYNVDPRSVIPYVADTGDIYYSISLSSLERGEDSPGPIMVPASEILHHRVFYTRHPLKGVSPLYAIGSSATMNAAISDNMASFHNNNSRPGGVLSIPGGLKSDARERLRREFAQNFGGVNAGKTAILDFDVKWNAMGYSAKDSDVVELLKYSVEDVCRALRIPKSMMGLDVSSTTSVEVQMRQYYSHCLRPMVEGLENRFDDFFGLIGTEYEFEFDIDELFRAETLTRVEALTKAIQGGVMSPNEARAAEDLPPIQGGDAVFLQRQMTSVALLEQLNQSELAAPAPAQQQLDYSAEVLKLLEPTRDEDMTSLILKELN